MPRREEKLGTSIRVKPGVKCTMRSQLFHKQHYVSRQGIRIKRAERVERHGITLGVTIDVYVLKTLSTTLS